jgi:L-malate glycosyltransferase
VRRQPVVCQVLHTLQVGGAEVLAARLARQLKHECQFVFVCLDEAGTIGEELRSEGFVVEVLGRKDGVDWQCAWRLAKFFQRAQVNLVHAHQYTPFFYSLLARLIYPKPPVLFTEHGRHFPDYPRPKRKVANRLLLQTRDRVVGVGQAVRQALIRNEGIPAQRVSVIYNGIDIDGPGGSNAREEARRELCQGDADFVILMVARLDYLKDHAAAIRMMARVSAVRPGARLVLVGEGPERRAIEDLVERNRLGAKIRFLGLRKDVARLLMASDVFLLTSISEGIPLTIIEAMVAGLPVVSTRVGGVPEIVVDGETGFLCPSGNDAALAEYVLKLAANPGLRERLGLHGQIRAKAAFSESLMHARYLELYREMLRG